MGSKKSKLDVERTASAFMRFAAAVDLIGWLNDRGDCYCGAKHDNVAFYYAVSGPDSPNEQEVEFLAKNLFPDKTGRESALRYRRDAIAMQAMMHGRA